ncbi:MAG: adenylate/guanylate cyclase domain-containing protein [Spirochaetales bacterium]
MDKLYLLGVKTSFEIEATDWWIEVLHRLSNRLKIQPRNIEYLVADSIARAEKLLFEYPISCILAINDKDILSFCSSLKQDELFGHLPIVLIASNSSYLPQESTLSIDLVLDGNLPAFQVADYLYPILFYKKYTSELEQKISHLQDDLLQKNLLIDLIRRYIPQTVWIRANTFAEEQTIFIPHSEEQVAIIYGDIEGFTRISEAKTPKEVIDLLNEALPIIVQVVYEEGGDIDKIIGDAFLAVHPEPLKALQIALKIQTLLQSSPIKFRIGVHYGPVIRGNVGSELRSDNTLIGDTVNTAARIEALTLAGEVMASEPAILESNLYVPSKYKRQISVKGKEEPLIVYEISRFVREEGLDLLSLDRPSVHLKSSAN